MMMLQSFNECTNCLRKELCRMPAGSFYRTKNPRRLNSEETRWALVRFCHTKKPRLLGVSSTLLLCLVAESHLTLRSIATRNPRTSSAHLRQVRNQMFYRVTWNEKTATPHVGLRLSYLRQTSAIYRTMSSTTMRTRILRLATSKGGRFGNFSTPQDNAGNRLLQNPCTSMGSAVDLYRFALKTIRGKRLCSKKKPSYST
mmetsp:Transcript_46053/g.68595  ORF Transcript_46053/g.68595 Transcript_46053/m.68595 type:complete len:200 (+) Transcript_46053:570-1169(+)